VELIISLVVLLVGAKLLGEVAERIGLPSVIGYIFAGVAAGPLFLNVAAPGDVYAFAELGIILMLFVTGFEQGNIAELLKNFRPIAAVSSFGYFLTYAAVVLVSLWAGLSFGQAILFGLILASTDLGISIEGITSAGKMGTHAGRTMLGVGVLDSAGGLLIFTLVMTYLSAGGFDPVSMGFVLLSIVAFLAMFMVLQRFVPAMIEQIEHMTVEQAEFSFAFVFMLFLAFMAQVFGLHGIIGAFLAGALLAHSPIAGTNFIDKISSISYAIFVPLFFVWTGLLLDFSALTEVSFIMAGAILVTTAIGAYTAARLCGFSDDEGVLMGIALLPRGDINLIIASIGITTIGVGGQLLVPPAVGGFMFSSTMLIVLFAAVLTAVLMKIFVKRGSMHAAKPKRA